MASLGATRRGWRSLLRAHGAGVNQPIGLLTLPGIATIVGIVGILRADATWLLLNTEYPTRRLREMVELAGARLVLYQQETEVFARRLQAELPAITLLRADDLPDADVAPPEPAATPDDLAYIIFTSGSTGAPKGVPITHRAIANYITWLIDTFGYGPHDRLLQAAAISFGAAVSQILGPLCSGGTIVPLPAAIVRDPAELLALVERERPTIWRSVPSLWDRLLTVIERRIADGQAPPPLAELRWIGVGGEPCHPAWCGAGWISMASASASPTTTGRARRPSTPPAISCRAARRAYHAHPDRPGHPQHRRVCAGRRGQPLPARRDRRAAHRRRLPLARLPRAARPDGRTIYRQSLRRR